MSMENNLNKFLEELIQEVEKELDEATATGNVAGYNTPAAFSDGGRKDKKRKKKIATTLGYSVVGNDVSNIDEARLNVRDLPSDVLSGPGDFEDWYDAGMEVRGKKKLAPMSKSDERKLFNLVEMWIESRDDRRYGSGSQDDIDDIIKSIAKFLTQKGKVVKESVNEAEIKWNAVDNAIVRYIKQNVKVLEKPIKARNEAETKKMLKGFIDGLVNAQRSLNLKESVKEATFRPNSGTMSGGTYGLDKRKYELKRDVKGVQIGDYTNVTLPKGTIIYNLPGGVFAHHRSLKSYEGGQNKYFNKPTFRGISVRQKKDTIVSIEKNSKILESVNEAINNSYYLQKYGANDDGKKVAKYSKFDKSKIHSDFNRYAKTLKDEEELHFMGVNTDKKTVGDDYLFSVVNQDGKNRIEITKGSRTFYKPFKSFKLESVNEAKVKRPVNRWLELKNDETMHPHKKMAMGLKELKYQLAETQKFFNWYGKIKSMNELDSSDYWKRTNKHIYKIKERLINIAKTIQEIEK